MNLVSPPSRHTREDIALLWVTRLAAEPGNPGLDEARLPAIDQQELQRWLAQDPANGQAYGSARRLWHLTGPGAAQLAREEDATLQALLRRAKAPRRRGRARATGLAVAATVALAGVLALMWQPERWLDDLQADYASAPGQLRSLTLADGSEVQLDGDSAIDVTLTDQGRDVRLRRGAAYFHVSHNGQPFVVHAGNGEVRVLGTHFEVRRQATGTQVTVEEGKVAVKPAANTTAVLLTASQRVDYHKGQAEALQAVNPQQAFGWRQGQLSFRRQPLADALAVVQRYYPGRIVLLNTELGHRLVSGDFASNDPNAMLNAFQGVLGYSQQRLPGGTLIIR
ncbi:putative transmembrane sensor protein [Pseudomonas sp. M47T1]|uniref:FecR family protein n=1 Tax=Pseudomonas sp. M47T1 TaxID=1179778 RepID=UPI0002606ED7|nr:FecR domain-containing protein [Pseudomonas sp. M47T1]EIK96998.1 putative transmembrane sensor protein [Pseudomonas sp. M47T1]